MRAAASPPPTGVVRALLLAQVLRGGAVREGDTVRLLDVNPEAPRPIRPKLP